MLHFIRNCQIFPEWLYNLALPPAICESSSYSTFLLALGIVVTFIILGIRIEMQWDFFVLSICISLMGNDVEHFFFHVLICHSMYSLVKCSFKSFAYFVEF